MNELSINICASIDEFGAYSDNCDGIYAAGDTIEACKKDVETAISLIREHLPVEQWPEPIRGDYHITWHYDDSAKIRMAYIEREEKQRKAKTIKANTSNDIPLERQMLHIIHSYQRIQDENERLKEENMALKAECYKSSMRYDNERRQMLKKKEGLKRHLDDLMKKYLEKKQQINELENKVKELEKELQRTERQMDEVIYKRSVLTSIDDKG